MADRKLSMGDLAAAVVAQDEELRGSLKGLVNDMIKHMRYTMRYGEPSAKTALSKQIIPQLLTAINKVDEDEGEKEEKAAYDRMMATLRGDMPDVRPDPPASDATEDIPEALPTESIVAQPPSPPARKKVAKKAPAKKAPTRKIPAKKAPAKKALAKRPAR